MIISKCKTQSPDKHHKNTHYGSSAHGTDQIYTSKKKKKKNLWSMPPQKKKSWKTLVLLPKVQLN